MVFAMNEQVINDIFDQLKSGELHEYYVKKEDFIAVRNVIVKRADFKHIRGIAQTGGGVRYQYLETPRS